jgi:signal transduction histidine kinase
MISSLQTRLLLAVGVLAVAAVAAVGFAARQSTRQEFERFQTLERVRDADDVEEVLDRVAAPLDGRCCVAGVLDAVAPLLTAEQTVLVFDERGTLIASAGTGLQPSLLQARFRDNVLTVDSRSREPGMTAGVSLSLRGGPLRHITLADGSSGSVHVLSMPVSDVNMPAAQFLGSVDRSLLWATAAVAGLALILTWAITRRIVGPIGELRDATRDLADGQLSRRVEVQGSDEVAELAKAFNTMASELERQQALRRSLVHDVAHELRTPLTALRCRVEAIVDGVVAESDTSLRQVNEEVAHLSQLVSDLDELARAEARELTLTMTDLDLVEVCRSAVRIAGLEEDPRLRLELEGPLTARGDAVRVRQILLNLPTNADRHTPAQGTIAFRAHVRNGEVEMTVSNTGSTLSPEECARVFDRFYRADPSRQRATGGSGLGLAIVKHLAEAQGGRVWARSDPSSGVTFGVALSRG